MVVAHSAWTVMALVGLTSIMNVTAHCNLRRSRDGNKDTYADDYHGTCNVDSSLDCPFWLNEGVPARPMHPDGRSVIDSTDCPAPLRAACKSKGVMAAHLQGPVDCGNRGWFCRFMPQASPEYRNSIWADPNFIYCNNSGPDIWPALDSSGAQGHCHAASADDIYQTLIHDHWFRGYASTLHCCCGQDAGRGIIDRCDLRTSDAAEGREFHWGCEGSVPSDPLYSGTGQCWSVESFADPKLVPGYTPTTSARTTTTTTSTTSEATFTTTAAEAGWMPVAGGSGRACRGSTASDNSPSYYVLHNGVPSLDDCKTKCEATAVCQGIEYNPAGRCEVWTRTEGIQASIQLNGYTCLRYTTNEPGSSFMPVDGGVGRACRGANSKDNFEGYYIKYFGVDTLAYCRNKCLATAGCQGIEHNPWLRRCEVWTRPSGIQASRPASGFSCFRYSMAAPSMLQLGSAGGTKRSMKSRRHSSLGTSMVQKGSATRQGSLELSLADEL